MTFNEHECIMNDCQQKREGNIQKAKVNQGQQFKYLGYDLTKEGKCDTENRRGRRIEKYTL